MQFVNRKCLVGYIGVYFSKMPVIGVQTQVMVSVLNDDFQDRYAIYTLRLVEHNLPKFILTHVTLECVKQIIQKITNLYF